MILTRQQWTQHAKAHRDRATTQLADVCYRRDRGWKHPVDDFLFHYYNLKPSQLIRWHPGAGVELADASQLAGQPFYRLEGQTVTVDVAAFLAKRGNTVREALRLLRAAEAARPKFGCFGMHEWAMVYRLQSHQTRHPYLALRYPASQIAQIVEEIGCRCTHFDAYRFFTAPAKPLNLLTPTREQQAQLDQPGCLHVNMDLYKWAGKLLPAVSS